MEKTLLKPEDFRLWFTPGDDEKTGARRAVGSDGDGALILRRGEAEGGAFGAEESDWLLSEAEYKALLIEALRRGKVTMAEYTELQKRAKPPEEAKKKPEPRKPAKPQEQCICRSEGVEIGLLKDTRPYLRLDGEEYTLSCHPYEPCTYIRKNSRVVITIHNAFEIYGAYDTLAEGGEVESISGRRYDAPRFSALLAAAVRAGREELGIETLEALLPEPEGEAADRETGN